MLSLKEAEARVVRGAELLDQTEPNWRDMVDTRVLSIAYSDRCTLGQVFEDFWVATQNLGLDSQAAEELGFYVSFNSEFEEDYRVLDRAWAREVAQV